VFNSSDDETFGYDYFAHKTNVTAGSDNTISRANKERGKPPMDNIRFKEDLY